MCSVGDDAVPAEVDESQSPTKPIVVLETFSLANDVCCVICYIQFMMTETISAYGLVTDHVITSVFFVDDDEIENSR